MYLYSYNKYCKVNCKNVNFFTVLCLYMFNLIYIIIIIYIIYYYIIILLLFIILLLLL